MLFTLSQLARWLSKRWGLTVDEPIPRRDRDSPRCFHSSSNNHEFLRRRPLNTVSCTIERLYVLTRVSWIALVFIAKGDNTLLRASMVSEINRKGGECKGIFQGSVL
mgnify:CR=1 FL=1